MRATAWRGTLLGMLIAMLAPAAARADLPNLDTGQSDDSSPSNAGDVDTAAHDWSVSLSYGYETFRGVSDGNWQNNGLNTGFNLGTRLGAFSDNTGIGFQLGASEGIYNWSGTDYRMRDNNEAQTQAFFTGGFFRKATQESPWAMGLVFDCMVNNNFGVYNETPTLDQWRYLIAYDMSDSDQFGLWGAIRGGASTRFVDGVGPVKWQSEDQIDFFWHRKWLFGADTSVWIGAPLGDSLDDGGSLGSFIAGARGDLPLNNWMALYSFVTYMRPAMGPGPAGAEHDEWSFVIGLTLYPRRDARTSTVANEGWAALLPVASNGNFFVDTSSYY